MMQYGGSVPETLVSFALLEGCPSDTIWNNKERSLFFFINFAIRFNKKCIKMRALNLSESAVVSEILNMLGAVNPPITVATIL
ncbi:MAG: hypothetical protein HQL74_11555 [Magnetococcales bacterium]|nr:hypothetical protein [Magnetococcales bacterium]